jgi:5-carboxymethyl-2-hydroxymuconic-semialdehyde dehydrogenase
VVEVVRRAAVETVRVTNALEAGMIRLNSENVRHLPTPFGGMKAAGIGRDGGDSRGIHGIQRLGPS